MNLDRLSRVVLSAAAAVATAAISGCATPDPAETNAKENPFYVTGSNIGRRDREVQRVQAVSGDALRAGANQIGDTIARPEGHRGAGN